MRRTALIPSRPGDSNHSTLERRLAQVAPLGVPALEWAWLVGRAPTYRSGTPGVLLHSVSHPLSLSDAPKRDTARRARKRGVSGSSSFVQRRARVCGGGRVDVSAFWKEMEEAASPGQSGDQGSPGLLFFLRAVHTSRVKLSAMKRRCAQRL